MVRRAVSIPRFWTFDPRIRFYLLSKWKLQVRSFKEGICQSCYNGGHQESKAWLKTATDCLAGCLPWPIYFCETFKPPDYLPGLHALPIMGLRTYDCDLHQIFKEALWRHGDYSKMFQIKTLSAGTCHLPRFPISFQDRSSSDTRLSRSPEDDFIKWWKSRFPKPPKPTTRLFQLEVIPLGTWPQWNSQVGIT